ncbi:MAG: primosomal replication protein N [Sodalis sp. Ffu]|nr:MAG: primosomal replication protein N [Sodalis sp. Ffu]
MLSGIVCRTPTRKVSPSGVPHCQFMLEHHSVQQEAGFSRKAWCRVPVVVSGKHLPNIIHHITIGAQITVQGFISNHQGSNGLSKMVLHAEQIDLMDSRG